MVGRDGGAAKLTGEGTDTSLEEQFTRALQLFIDVELMPTLAVRGGRQLRAEPEHLAAGAELIPFSAWNVCPHGR